ncbi:MAG: hypothetical protein JW917_01080 [Ignavibacteria bacterium]|nr:hypothetical protein [Ignavibacteria bacterium]
MRNLILLVILILFTALISGCSLFSRKYEKLVSENAIISSIDKEALILENTNGDIRIHKSSDSLINIKVEKTVYLKKSELDDNIDWININIDSSGKIVKVTIDIIREIRFFNLKAGGSTDIDVYVPENLFVSIESTNASAEFDKIKNDVKIKITNGKVKAENITGNMEAYLTNGKIYAAPDSGKDCNLKITNGNVYLDISGKTTGNFDISVTNGKIDAGSVKFDSIEEKQKNYLKAKIGETTNRITVKVTNGKIKLSEDDKKNNED